ncbi:MAG: phosphoribosylanthranilate isomerase [Candidatus Omnitrophota bacterium]
MVKVKVCGITNLDDAQAATGMGADMLGFVFYKKSPRYISPKRALDIISNLPQHVEKVALFVNEKEENVRAILNQIKEIGILQFHGEETPQYCGSFNKAVIKAVRVKDAQSIKALSLYEVNYFLLDAFKEDAYGGTGEKFNWELAKEAKSYKIPIILSGGLNPENVEEAIRVVEPFMVDVSSGVEISPGKKDPELIKKFMEVVKK